MADGGHHLVMFPVVKHKGDCPNGLGHCDDTPGIGAGFQAGGGGDAFGRRHDIIGILQKMVRGVFIAGFFRTRHGMAAHETILKSLADDFFMNAALGAPNVCYQCSGL